MRRNLQNGRNVIPHDVTQKSDTVLLLDRKSVPLSQVLETMQVFISKNGGSKTGIFHQPSKQDLLENFYTDNIEEIFEIILETGQVENLHQSKHVEAYQTIFRGYQS
jgi:ribosome maturation protein Sdo1